MHIKPIVLILSLCASAFGQGFKFSDLPFLYNVGIEGQYLLYDDFNIPLAAGSVNGTQPTFGPKMGPGGPRTVTDTESKLSISGGQLVFSGGKSSAVDGDPEVWYALQARVRGKTLLGSFSRSADGTSRTMGFDNNTSGFQGRSTFEIGTSYSIRASDLSTSIRAVGTVATATSYSTAISLRDNSAFYFIKGGSYPTWTLLYASDVTGAGDVYPCSSTYNVAVNVWGIRIPTALFTPTPLVSDGFQAANGTALSAHTTDGYGHQETNGGSGLTWTGNNWGILSNKATNAPATGGDVILDGDFATDPGPWTKNSWTIGSGVATHPLGATDYLSTNVLTIGSWYVGTFDVTRCAAGICRIVFSSTWFGNSVSSVGSFCETGRAKNSGLAGIRGDSTFDGDVDNITYRPLTLSDCISHVTVSSTPDILADACWTRGTTNYQFGIVANYDSATGTNGVFAYYDGSGTVNVDVQVNGNWTNKITGAITWVDNAPLRLISVPSAGELRCYYNNALVGSAVTSGFWPGFTNFTRCGLFSTWTNASCTNFVVWARSAPEYQVLNNY